MIGAALSRVLGWRFGFATVFTLAAVFGALTVVAVLGIPARRIDDGAARGATIVDHHVQVKGMRVLGLFHLGNAAMLPATD